MWKIHHGYQKRLLISIVVMSVAAISCGGKNDVVKHDVEECLPLSIDEPGAERISDVDIYAGESLWEYINGDAEIYHQYYFEKVATAYYNAGSHEIVADIYEFSGSVNAYGLYTTVRPDNPEFASLGITGFLTANSLTFVKGEYVVRLTAYTSGEDLVALLPRMATLIESCLPGTIERPGQFSGFCTDGIIPNTDKYVASSFQGQSFLSEFFTQDYYLDGDTVTLFMTLTDAAPKLSQWREAAMTMGGEPIKPDDPPFADEYLAVRTFSGVILAGLKNDRLAGMINYSDRHRRFLTDWLRSLP